MKVMLRIFIHIYMFFFNQRFLFQGRDANIFYSKEIIYKRRDAVSGDRIDEPFK